MIATGHAWDQNQPAQMLPRERGKGDGVTVTPPPAAPSAPRWSRLIGLGVGLLVPVVVACTLSPVFGQ
jgi:hypothetical protein